MRKIALDVETLAVESFEAGRGEPMGRGTVQANGVQANGGMLSVATRDTSCDRTRCCPRTNLC